MTHSPLTILRGLFHSIGIARNAVSQYNHLLARGDGAKEAAETVFQAHYRTNDAPSVSRHAPRRNEDVAWNRLSRMDRRYAD